MQSELRIVHLSWFLFWRFNWHTGVNLNSQEWLLLTVSVHLSSRAVTRIEKTIARGQLFTSKFSLLLFEKIKRVSKENCYFKLGTKRVTGVVFSCVCSMYSIYYGGILNAWEWISKCPATWSYMHVSWYLSSKDNFKSPQLYAGNWAATNMFQQLFGLFC